MLRLLRWRWFIILPFLLFLTSCGHTMVLNSSPNGANVFFLSPNGDRQSSAGQTPLSLPAPKDGGQRYYLELEKTGFVPTSIFVEQAHIGGSSTDVSIKLKAQDRDWFLASFSGAFSNEASDLINTFVELRTRITDNDAASVQKLEKQLGPKFSKFSIYNALLGEFYQKQGNAAKAKGYFSKAVELNPQDLESRLALERMNPKSKKK